MSNEHLIAGNLISPQRPLPVQLYKADGTALLGLAATIADGADVTQGALADAAVAAGAAGSESAKLRRLTTDLDAVLTKAEAIRALLAAPIALDAGTLAALETINVGNLPATQPISAAALPLPSGAATEASLLTRLTSAIFQGIMGEVQASPTANTVLDRLKALLTGIVLAAGENHVGQVGGHALVAAATQFARPGDTMAYASGDLVANSTTAGSVVSLQFTVARVAAGSGMIRRARLRKSGTGITNASFRLHLYKSSPTPANGDNGAWSTDKASDYLGAFDVVVDRAFTDGAAGNGVPTNGSEITFSLASGQIIYGLTEARGAYTPGNAETFDWSLEVLPN